MARLDEKVAVITGGESGIGLASARPFVSEGAKVHLVGIDAGKLADAVAELGDDRALASDADVTDEDAVRRAIAGAWNATSGSTSCSSTPASAARSPGSPTTRRTCSRAWLAVRVLGAFHMLKHGIPHVSDGGSYGRSGRPP